MSFVNVGTHRLWVTEKGRGTPVVLLHSLFFDSRIWEPIEDELVDQHRVLAVDVRDHGRSEGPDARWNLTDAAGEVHRAVDQLVDEPVHVVGVSMGGMIGLRWALANPDRVRSLGLVSTTHRPEVRARLHKAMTYLVRFGGRAATELVIPYASNKMFSDDFRDDPRADEWNRRIATTDPQRLFRAGQAVFDREDLTDRLDRIEAPSLVVVGDEDAAIPPDHGHELAQRLPDAELVEVEEAGHMLPIEAPRTLADELVHFLRRAEAKTVEDGKP